MVEKYHGWTDCGHQPGGQSIGGHPENALPRDAMLDTVSLYWFTASAASSARLYWHSFRGFVAGEIHVPTACSLFGRSEEHTSELQSLMRISYAVFCLKKKKQHRATTITNTNIQWH